MVALVSDDGDDDVIYVSEEEPTTAQRDLAAKYQLPKTFYLYETREACKGECARIDTGDNVM